MNYIKFPKIFGKKKAKIKALELQVEALEAEIKILETRKRTRRHPNKVVTANKIK